MLRLFATSWKLHSLIKYQRECLSKPFQSRSALFNVLPREMIIAINFLLSPVASSWDSCRSGGENALSIYPFHWLELTLSLEVPIPTLKKMYEMVCWTSQDTGRAEIVLTDKDCSVGKWQSFSIDICFEFWVGKPNLHVKTNGTH